MSVNYRLILQAIINNEVIVYYKRTADMSIGSSISSHCMGPDVPHTVHVLSCILSVAFWSSRDGQLCGECNIFVPYSICDDDLVT